MHTKEKLQNPSMKILLRIPLLISFQFFFFIFILFLFLFFIYKFEIEILFRLILVYLCETPFWRLEI